MTVDQRRRSSRVACAVAALTDGIASHAWDCAAAKAAGFVTAYTTTYEYDECVDIFGKADFVAPDLVSLGQGIVDKWGRK